MNVETLGKFLRKFGTSNPWATGSHISIPMVHLFLGGHLESDWRSFPTLEVVPYLGTNFETLGTSLKKIGIYMVM